MWSDPTVAQISEKFNAGFDSVRTHNASQFAAYDAVQLQSNQSQTC